MRRRRPSPEPDRPRPVRITGRADPSSMSTVAAIVLHWRNPAATCACLASLRSLEGPLSIIVVDNSGTWETVVAVDPLAGRDITLLRPGKNLGYTGGNNRGLDWAFSHGCDWAWLLNDDVTVAKDALAQLLAAASAMPKVGILGPLVLMKEDPQRILSAGGYFGPGMAALQRGVGDLDHGQFRSPVEAGFVSGCALLVHRAVIEEVGGLDEAFFTYYEEVEWCYRAQRAGWHVLFVPSAHVWHPDTRQRDPDSPRVTYYMARNALLFARKHRLRATLARRLLESARTLASWSFRPKWRHKRGQRNALARALADFARGQFGEAEWSHRGHSRK